MRSFLASDIFAVFAFLAGRVTPASSSRPRLLISEEDSWMAKVTTYLDESHVGLYFSPLFIVHTLEIDKIISSRS